MMGAILVEYGKHGETFWPASTEEEWAKSSLAILTLRFHEGYWYDKSYPDYAEIKRIVQEQDDSWFTYRSGRREPIAFEMLASRNDYEYERVEYERLQEI